MTDAGLISEALRARGNSYSPYSRFAVGAALLCSGGRVYTGANVENSSYGAAICAERAAVVAAVTAGEREFIMLAVAASGEEVCLPCGICRQVLAEFSADILVLCANERGEFQRYLLSELFPKPFRL